MKNARVPLLAAFFAALFAAGALRLLRGQRTPPTEAEIGELLADIEGTPALAADTGERRSLAAPAGVAHSADERASVPAASERELEAAERLREERRRIRLEERYRRQAARIVAELGLSEADEEAIYAILVQEHSRREALFDSLEAGTFAPDFRERIRRELVEIQVWKRQALREKLGPEVAEAVLDGGREPGAGDRDYSDPETEDPR